MCGVGKGMVHGWKAPMLLSTAAFQTGLLSEVRGVNTHGRMPNPREM